MSTIDNNSKMHSLPQTHEETKPLPEAELPALRQRPTQPEGDLEAASPSQYVGIDQGGGGCIVYLPDGKRTDLKSNDYNHALQTISRLSGITQEVLQDNFLELKKGKTLIKAELTNPDDLEQFARFFMAVWEYVVPPEFWNPETVFVSGMTGKTRKTLFDLGLDQVWTQRIVDGMGKRKFRGYFLLLDCDFESLMEARDFNKFSDMLERAPLFTLVQIGSSSSQASIHANIGGHRQVLCHGKEEALGSRFTEERRAELETAGVNSGPYFRDFVRELFSKFDSLTPHAAVLNSVGYIGAALVDHITSTYEVGSQPVPEETLRIIQQIRGSEFVETAAMCKMIRQNMQGAPTNEYFQFNLLLEVLDTMYAKGNRYVILERKLHLGKSYAGGIWSREFTSFLKTQPVPVSFEGFDISTLP